MYANYNDVIWSSGREGGYLVLGNMVYTVKQRTSLISRSDSNKHLFSMWL